MSMNAIIRINGESRPYHQQTVRELLAEHGFNPDRPGIAVAVNARVIPRDEWDSARLQPNDRVEIIRATAGG